MGQQTPYDDSGADQCGADQCGADNSTARALALAELVAARLCHDISGALSTVMNAIDLAGEDPAGGAREEALALAHEASTILGQRLRLLRTAWAEADQAIDIAALLSARARVAVRAPPEGRRVGGSR